MTPRGVVALKSGDQRLGAIKDPKVKLEIGTWVFGLVSQILARMHAAPAGRVCVRRDSCGDRSGYRKRDFSVCGASHFAIGRNRGAGEGPWSVSCGDRAGSCHGDGGSS